MSDKKNIYSVYEKPVEIVKDRNCFKCEKIQCDTDMIDCPFEYFVEQYDQKEKETEDVIQIETKTKIV